MSEAIANMDLLKTPSVQSLVDSDIGSVESLQSLDIEELDETEYGLPAAERAPSLAELLSEESAPPEPGDCSSLQAELLQAISQQLSSAQARSAAGPATTLTVGGGGRLAVGTAHGHLLAFQGQTLRWACDSNSDRGAITCLAYNGDSTRLLAGYARGLICQFESSQGIALRRVVPGGGVWGALRVAWAEAAALALDTGGSVWLLKFSRPLGVRSARVSCLFSGARGEVVAMAARDARILALATLSRVIVVAGGRAAAVRLTGPPETLPVLAWCECEERVLVCARGVSLQWHMVNVGGTSVSLRPLRRAELPAAPLWMGWLGGRLAILDVAERLRLWEDEDDRALDLAQFQPVYASVFFKGVWTDGRVSRALSRAGAGALGGACAADGALTVLGGVGVVRVKTRDVLQRARALAAAGRAARALRLLCSARSEEARRLAATFVGELAERAHALQDRDVAVAAVRLCVKNGLQRELWGRLWEAGAGEAAFVEAVGAAAAEGMFKEEAAPSPDVTQALLEHLVLVAPDMVERVLVALPLTSLDPHAATVLVRERGLWRAAAALAGVLGGAGAALRDLAPLVRRCREGGRAGECRCAGDALLVCAADGLGGRGAGGTRLPEHARPAARHETLRVLLACEGDAAPPLRLLLQHDTRSVVRLLEMSTRDPPFAGPLGKQNRLRVARALLEWTSGLEDKDRLEVIKFVSGQLNSGTLPPDRELTLTTRALAAHLEGEDADRAWLALLERPHTRGDLTVQLVTSDGRPRVRWHILELLGQHGPAIDELFTLHHLTESDVDELYQYLSRRAAEKNENTPEQITPHLRRLVEVRPRAAAALLTQAWPDCVPAALAAAPLEPAIEFAESLIGLGALTGPAAAIHLRNLCIHNPKGVVKFLKSNPGLVRPEDALDIVRENGPKSAEPICLEAAGDSEGAVQAAVDLIAEAEDTVEKEELIAQACELCARVAPMAPVESSVRMWNRLLDCEAVAAGVPPAALLEAVSYVPVDTLVARACAASSKIAIALCNSAAGREAAVRRTARILDLELHTKLAQSVRRAGRAVSVRSAKCTGCGGALSAQPPVRVWPCGHATHVECGVPSRCSACGMYALLEEVRTFNQPTAPALPPLPFELQLVAPPRPDLEGLA